MLKAALLALISAAVCCAQAPSTAQQKGSVSGTVASATGEPLKSATLRLQGQPSSGNSGVAAQPLAYSASSDAQGNFTFQDLEPGRYTLSSERAGYLRTTYSTSSNGPVASLDLTSGQTLTGIAIKMTPQALISGRITDEDGEPYPNVRVDLTKWMYVGGQKRLQPSNVVNSNAEGVFAIGSLAAGSYYIGATPPSVPPSLGIHPGPEETYVTTYYPGATDPASAIAVQVAAGAVARGIEIRLRKARAFRVRGKLVDLAGGAAPANANLVLVPKDGPNLPGPTPNAMVRDGTFVFAGVLPGVYILQAMPGRASSGMARQLVAVGNADVDDLVVQLGPGAEITGTISIDGTVPPPQPQQPGTPGTNARPTVFLMAADGVRGSFQQPQPNDDGTFVIHNIMPGTYQVSVQSLPAGTYVKSIRFGSQDLMKTPLDLSGGSGGAINVVLSPNAGDISGIVHGADGTALMGVFVTLWTPGVPMEGIQDFTRTTATDVNGQFKFASLPPGEYRIAAWEQIEPGLGTVPEFRIKFESKAAAVRLDENAHENIEAPLIPRDAIETEAAKLQ
jgi:hypothetical protein